MRIANNVNNNYQNKQAFGMKMIVPPQNQEAAMTELYKIASKLSEPSRIKNTNGSFSYVFGDMLALGKRYLNNLYEALIDFNKNERNHKLYKGKVPLKIQPYWNERQKALEIRVSHDSTQTYSNADFDGQILNSGKEDLSYRLKSLHSQICLDKETNKNLVKNGKAVSK